MDIKVTYEGGLEEEHLEDVWSAVTNKLPRGEVPVVDVLFTDGSETRFHRAAIENVSLSEEKKMAFGEGQAEWEIYGPDSVK